MKKLLLFSILFFLSTFSIVAQSPCPLISVTAPNGLVKIGDSMTFTAKVDGISLENLKYEWTLTNGVITSGQGTLAINVATKEDMTGQTITATIEVSGLPQNCRKSFSASGEIETIISCLLPRKFDEYKNISWLDEKQRLDEVVKILKDEQETNLVFRFTTKEKILSKIFKTRQLRIAKYLTAKHKISKDRILFIISDYGNDLTEIYLIPVGVEFPS